MGQIVLVKLTMYITEKMPKKQKFHCFVSWQNTVNLKKIPRNQTISIPYLLQAQPSLSLLSLAYYCGF